MSECRDLHVGTAVRPFASPTSSVQWTERHCKWLPVCAAAEVLLGGRSWAGKGSQRECYENRAVHLRQQHAGRRRPRVWAGTAPAGGPVPASPSACAPSSPALLHPTRLSSPELFNSACAGFKSSRQHGWTLWIYTQLAMHVLDYSITGSPYPCAPSVGWEQHRSLSKQKPAPSLPVSPVILLVISYGYMLPYLPVLMQYCDNISLIIYMFWDFCMIFQPLLVSVNHRKRKD